MKQLIQQIEQWAEDRNLIKGSTPQKQLFKFAEELGELFAGHNKKDKELIKDSIGDCFVALTILSAQFGYHCLDDDILEAYECYQFPPEKFSGTTNLNFLLSWTGNLASALEYEEIADPFELVGLLAYNLMHYAYGAGFDFYDCVKHAYDQIKDRKGKMIDGVFVKEEDLCD